MEERGYVVDRTYQLNVGGNMDFKNMLERDRLEPENLQTRRDLQPRGALADSDVPSDRRTMSAGWRTASSRSSGWRAMVGNAPMSIEYKLEVGFSQPPV